MIGFTGPYADVNFGDYAMLVNNVYALQADKVLVFSYDDEFLAAVAERYFDDVTVEFLSVEGLDQAALESLDLRAITPAEILGLVTNLDQVRAAVAPLDALYVNGGGYFNSLWSRPHRIRRLLQIMVPALVADAAGIPVTFTANGFGPFRGDEEFFAAFFATLRGARIASRDALLSPYWLNRVGVESSEVTVIPDDLFFLDARLEPIADRYRPDRYVVLETYLPVDTVRAMIPAFRRFVEAMKVEHGCSVVFLPLNLAHGGVDQGRLLADEIRGIELIDIETDGYLTIERASHIVRDAELVLSSRYHSLILALANEVPFVSVLKEVLGDRQYYYNKNFGALQGALGKSPLRGEDYFHSDFESALRALELDFAEIRSRQLHEYASVRPNYRAEWLRSRMHYLAGREGVTQ